MSYTIDSIDYSNASQLLGMSITSLDIQARTLDAQFLAKPEFLNRAGNVQGGFISAMLDDLMGYALGGHIATRLFCANGKYECLFFAPSFRGYALWPWAGAQRA